MDVHLLAVTEDVAALSASSTGRVEVIVTGLKHFARDVSLAVVTLDAKLFLPIKRLEQLWKCRGVDSTEVTNLVVLLAVHLAILVKILAVQNGATGLALETPNVPVLVQCNQRLAFGYLFVAVVAYCKVITGVSQKLNSWAIVLP